MSADGESIAFELMRSRIWFASRHPGWSPSSVCEAGLEAHRSFATGTHWPSWPEAADLPCSSRVDG